MKQITISTEIKQVEDAIFRWKSIAGNKLPDCFEKFFPLKNGIQDQRQRLSAIRFGKVTKEFKNMMGDKTNQLWLRMALFPEIEEVTRTLEITQEGKKTKKVSIKESVVAREVFSVVLKIVNGKGESTYFTSSSLKNLLKESNSVFSSGLQYGASRSSEFDLNSSAKLIGLRPVVSNEMCMNWCLVDPYKIPGLFNVVQPDLSGMAEAQRVFYELTNSLEKDRDSKLKKLFDHSLSMTADAIYDPYNSAVVRAHGYKVNGYDLSALSANIKNSDERKIDGYFTIHLGMKDPGVNFNEGQFSLVTEFLEASPESPKVLDVQSFEDLTKDNKKDLIMELNDQVLFAPGIGLEGESVNFWVNNKHIQGEVTAKFNGNTASKNVTLVLDEKNGWEFDFQSYSSSFDDFLHPCPPFCGSGTGGNP